MAITKEQERIQSAMSRIEGVGYTLHLLADHETEAENALRNLAGECDRALAELQDAAAALEAKTA